MSITKTPNDYSYYYLQKAKEKAKELGKDYDKMDAIERAFLDALVRTEDD
tara:strand:+ start:1195 stop:1344 length:150 start_codon:yes stop_codon:yes gene_type:complete